MVVLSQADQSGPVAGSLNLHVSNQVLLALQWAYLQIHFEVLNTYSNRLVLSKTRSLLLTSNFSSAFNEFIMLAFCSRPLRLLETPANFLKDHELEQFG